MYKSINQKGSALGCLASGFYIYQKGWLLLNFVGFSKSFLRNQL